MPQPGQTSQIRAARRRDEVTGFWPGVQLAVGLATLTGMVTVAALAGWIWFAGAAGLFRAGSTGLIEAAGWWAAFWLVLSAGLLVGLWGGYRAWYALYPLPGRYRAARAALREERAAVEEAQAFLDGVGRTRDGS